MSYPLTKTPTARGRLAILLGLEILLVSIGEAGEHRGRQVALVIGNGAYRSMTRLLNPGNDAQQIGKKLAALGFKVTVQVDRGKQAMENDLASFYKEGRDAALALFFYAGHGIQADGRNYLIPVDAEPPEDEAGMHRQAVELEYVVEQVQKGAHVGLIFLDACRNNPGLESRVSGATRDAFRDVRLAEVPRGTVLVLYAASRGQRALDTVSGGKNSPFAESLLSHLGDATPVQLLPTLVAADVKKRTAGRQRPEMQGNLDEVIFLSTPSSVKRSVTTSRGPTTALPASPLRPSMVRIKPGTFLMGSQTDEQSRQPDEVSHQVRISRSFLMSTTEVTQGQYQAVMGTNPSKPPKNADLPVQRITWHDAIRYCNKLSQSEQLAPCYQIDGENVTWAGTLNCAGYRLPTEAEWEYAARGGQDTIYAGSSNLEEVAWYRGNSKGMNHRVGEKSPNEWGFYDLSGNVWEWVWDWYGPYLAVDAADPIGPGSGSYRVYRGGAWSDEEGGVRVAYRGKGSPGLGYHDQGFRLAKSIP